jgi:mono/diheme cytochrome c family protein
MKRVLKGVGIVLGFLVAIVIGVLVVTYIITEHRWNKTYTLTEENVEVSDDPDIIAHGRHVITIRGCVDCHGEDLGGKVFIEDPVAGRIVATNLTTGTGGIGSEYTDEDLVRAIRRGIKKDGKPTLFMPSYEYNQIHQRDINAMISYIRSVPPVDKVLPENKIGIPMRAMYVFQDDLNLFSAEIVDHSAPIPTEEPSTVLEKGQYLSTSCIGCHRPDFKGGTIPGVPPHWPPASDLTQAGPLATWSEADFFRAMRDGITPDGRQLDSDYMPYPITGQMTDEELHALFVYLQSLDNGTATASAP